MAAVVVADRRLRERALLRHLVTGLSVVPARARGLGNVLETARELLDARVDGVVGCAVVFPMRVYLPATSTSLATLDRVGALGPAPLTAFAVTPGLREWYIEGDLEELEYAALSEAARASLRLIAADASAAPRRIVVAADVDDADVSVRDDLDRGVVRINIPVPWGSCASVHVDDSDAEPVIARAAPLADAADVGDEAAEEAVDDADGFELSWFATQEIPEILADLS